MESGRVREKAKKNCIRTAFNMSTLKGVTSALPIKNKFCQYGRNSYRAGSFKPVLSLRGFPESLNLVSCPRSELKYQGETWRDQLVSSVSVDQVFTELRIRHARNTIYNF